MQKIIDFDNSCQPRPYRNFVLAMWLLVILCSPALAGDQDSAIRRYVNQGITYHSNRNYLLAIKSFKQALALDPSNMDVLENISIAHNNYGKYLAERTDGKGAMREFRRSLFYNPGNATARDNLEYKLKQYKIDAKDPLARVKEANEEKKNKNYFAAIAELTEANLIEERAEAYTEIGSIYHLLALKNYGFKHFVDEAISNLEKASHIDNEYIPAKLRLGDIYVAQGQISKGITIYEHALRTSPDNEEAQAALISGWLAAIRVAPNIASNHIGLATAYQIKGELEKAEYSFRRAMQLDPNSAQAAKGLSSLKEDKIKTQVSLYLDKAIKLQKAQAYDKSLDYYIKALSLQPENPDIHFNIATAFQAKNDYPRAKKAFKRVLELKPDYTDAKNALEALENHEQNELVAKAFDHAIKLQESGNNKDAIAVYQRIAKDRPDDDSLFYNLGTGHLAQKEFKQAIASFKRAYKLNQDTSYTDAIRSAQQNWADDLLDSAVKKQNAGQIAEAIKDYEASLKIENANPSAWFNLGTAYQAEAQTDKAISAYQEAYKQDPKGQADAMFFAALLLEEQKKLEPAIDLYERYMSTQPDGDYVQNAKERVTYIKSFL